MAERGLSERELNRSMLARQLLLERARMPLHRAIERVAALQTQYAPSGYLSLWSRLDGFRREDLTRALERRRVIQGWLMRVTIHMASARDYWPMALAVRRSRRELWLRNHKRELAEVDMSKVARLVRRLLRDGPRRAKELQDLVMGEGYPRPAWVGAGLWVDVVRVPPSGTWERPPGRPVRPGRGLARPAEPHREGGDRALGPPVLPGVRAGLSDGPLELVRHRRDDAPPGDRAAPAPQIPGRGRQ